MIKADLPAATIITIHHANINTNMALSLNIYTVAALRFACLGTKAADYQITPCFLL